MRQLNVIIRTKTVKGELRPTIILVLKDEKQLRNENHTYDWELGLHLGDNVHVTEWLRPKKMSDTALASTAFYLPVCKAVYIRYSICKS